MTFGQFCLNLFPFSEAYDKLQYVTYTTRLTYQGTQSNGSLDERKVRPIKLQLGNGKIASSLRMCPNCKYIFDEQSQTHK